MKWYYILNSFTHACIHTHSHIRMYCTYSTHTLTHKSIVVSFFRGRLSLSATNYTNIQVYIHRFTYIIIYMYVCNYRVLRKCIFRIICMYFCSLVNKKKMFWLYFCGIFRRTDFLIYQQYQSKCLIKSNQANYQPKLSITI